MIRIAASSLVLGTMLFIGAAQAEPAKLTAPQMDQVTAGDLHNFNATLQFAIASARSCSQAGCGNGSWFGNRSEAEAAAVTQNYTSQANVIVRGH